MRLYLKTIESTLLNKAYAVFYETKAAQDIINNILAGNVEVKNDKAYDELYSKYITNIIKYDKYSQEIERSLLGEKIIIPGATTYISPARGKMIIRLDDSFKNKEDVESYLIGRGFEIIDIE